MAFSFTAPRFTVAAFIKENDSMTNIEKIKANNSLTGSVKPIDERSEFLNEKLRGLRIQLDLDTSSDKAAYRESQRRVPGFANSLEFLLMILRAARFDVKLAAKKLINYWHHKLEIFGPEIAFRPDGRIHLSDLSNDDLTTLESMGLCCLPRDKKNRGILFSKRKNWIIHSKRKNLSRLLWYLLQVTTEDPEIQKNGVVLILDNLGEISTDHYDRFAERQFRDVILTGFPCHIAGVHLFFDSKFYELLLPFLLYLFQRELRSRLRLHAYSLWPVQDLEEYGISEDSLPLQLGGKFQIDVAAWKKERINVENSMKRKASFESSAKSWPDLHKKPILSRNLHRRLSGSYSSRG